MHSFQKPTEVTFSVDSIGDTEREQGCKGGPSQKRVDVTALVGFGEQIEHPPHVNFPAESIAGKIRIRIKILCDYVDVGVRKTECRKLLFEPLRKILI